MLGKLFKYEFRAVARTLVPLYIGTLLLALLNGFALHFEFNFFTGLMLFALSAFGIAIFVVTLVLIIQRFWNNLLKDEGYLMFTLPVSSYQLVASKLLSALIWIILGGIVGILSIFAWLLPLNLEALGQFFRDFSHFWEQLKLGLSQFDISLFSGMFRFAFAALLSTLSEVQILYLSMALSQLPVFSRHRVGASFLSFLLINFICQKLSGLFVNSYFQNLEYVINESNMNLFIRQFSGALSSALDINNLFNAGLILLSFFLTGWILKNKLNLE